MGDSILASLSSAINSAGRSSKPGARFDLAGGMVTASAPDTLSPGQYPLLINVRRNQQGRISSRPPLSDNLLTGTLASAPTSLLRLNDTLNPALTSGYVLVIGAAGTMYVNVTSVATALSGLPLGFVTFRPDASPQPWAYISDPSTSVSIPAYVSSGYGLVCGMLKVRSDGTTFKQGVKEPQTAPTVSFVGGGSGTTQIYYRYTYRSSITGAPSNPSPESIPGTNSQSSPSATVNASDYATKITFNATQYEYNSGQLRTTGSVGPGVVTDYVIFHNFGFAIPDGVNIDGFQIDLNWLGQHAGTGILTAVSGYYLGQPFGTAKFPGIANQSFATDTLQGGNSDAWGMSGVTPAIVNDNSFGFGVQITTQEVGSTDRSFLDYMTVTVYYSTQNANVTPVASLDPQVDKIDFWRMGGALPAFTYVGTGPNSAAAFNDTLNDLAALGNPLLQLDNYEPFPSIGLPLAGTANVTAGSVAGTMQMAVASGDNLPLNMLPGTDVIIGNIAYTTYNRPTSATEVTLILPSGQSVPSPGTGLTFEIAEPDLASTPSPVEWGPTPDNGGSFCFGLDPINTGDLLWTNGNNFDSADQGNRLSVTTPSEPLMNGTITSELATVFSTDRFWLIYPNFADVSIVQTGVQGSVWTLIQSAATRGLYMRYAIDALGATIAWRAKDGIAVSMGGGPEQMISGSGPNIGIYNLFPHGGQQPSPVVLGPYTVYPPDDTKPNAQTIKIAPGYILYNYQDTTGTPRHLVFDMEAKGWSVDAYTPEVNCHLWAVGQTAQLLAGCTDGTVRQLITGGTETGTSVVLTRSEDGGSSRVVKRMGGWFLRAVASAAVTLAFYAQRFQTAITGFTPSTVGPVSGENDYLIDFTSAANADVRDIGAILTWPLGSANVLSEYQIDWEEVPEQIAGYKTGMLSYGAQSWMTVPWIEFAYQSTAIVNLVMALDNGSSITLSFPSTAGIQAKTFMPLPANKFKLVGWTHNSSSPYTVFAADCVMLLCEWGAASRKVNPFTGYGVPTSTT